MKVYSWDEFCKAMTMVSHEPKKPPKMEPKLKPVKMKAEGYKEPKRINPDASKPPKQSFRIYRKKGPEEAKRQARTEAKEKRQERKEETEVYGQPLD